MNEKKVKINCDEKHREGTKNVKSQCTGADKIKQLEN